MIYDHSDDSSALPNPKSLLARKNRRAVREADLVVAGTSMQAEKIRAIRADVLYLPDAADENSWKATVETALESKRGRRRILTPFKELKPPLTRRITVVKFPMIHEDERGETHFGVQDIPAREVAMGPPPNPPGQMRDFGAVTTMCVISFPAGTDAPAHNAPQPYVVIVLSGEGEG